jgi:putative DNA primase/helicase
MKKIITSIGQLIGALRHRLTDRAHHQPVNYANIRALLLYLCDFDEEKCLWVMRWLAYPLRNPGAKMSRALVIAGLKGAGKRLFFERVLTELYADGGARVFLQPLATVTSWPTGVRLMIVAEALSRGNQDRLKDLVIAKEILQRPAGGIAARRPNRTNFVLIADAPHAVLADSGHRRLCVIHTPGPMSTAFYRSVEYEIENDGVDAFRDFLMRDLDMAGFDQMTPPPADLPLAEAQAA